MPTDADVLLMSAYTGFMGLLLGGVGGLAIAPQPLAKLCLQPAEGGYTLCLEPGATENDLRKLTRALDVVDAKFAERESKVRS